MLRKEKKKNSKYRLVTETPIKMFGTILYQVEALRDFGVCYDYQNTENRDVCKTGIDGFLVKEGERGGYIESENNLSMEGNSWVGPGAAVFEGAVVMENAWIHGGNSQLPTVSIRGNAAVFGDSQVRDFAQVRDNAKIGGTAVVKQYARVEDCACVLDSEIGGNTWILGDTFVSGGNVVLDFNARPSRIGSEKDLEQAINSVETAKRNGNSLKIIK